MHAPNKLRSEGATDQIPCLVVAKQSHRFAPEVGHALVASGDLGEQRVPLLLRGRPMPNRRRHCQSKHTQEKKKKIKSLRAKKKQASKVPPYLPFPTTS